MKNLVDSLSEALFPPHPPSGPSGALQVLSPSEAMSKNLVYSGIRPSDAVGGYSYQRL